jgi:hypothetical protein
MWCCRNSVAATRRCSTASPCLALPNATSVWPHSFYSKGQEQQWQEGQQEVAFLTDGAVQKHQAPVV